MRTKCLFDVQLQLSCTLNVKSGYLGLVKEDIIKHLATELNVPDHQTSHELSRVLDRGREASSCHGALQERNPNDSVYTGIEDPVVLYGSRHPSGVTWVNKAKDEGGDVLIRGTGDDSKGYFMQPTIILTKDPESITMKEDIWSCHRCNGFLFENTVYVYDDTNYEKTLELINNTLPYALIGSMRVALQISAMHRKALLTPTNKLRNTAGNVYYHEECAGAVVGQQPFGGG
ncbi:uncharacterized protein HD556DRAFT_1311182 [Suillus plorans]|uniref:Uncharacterized protein n=1 Tax=Suillus plorans TaxID=116603 RepID=A0A9P7DEI1_9AGAM|nr:uncharacterized protein HD556DRAFT_1311182 [Suillus plorans]KAG1789587.1 hypothetical protein HD556DRAFT_1311182 [Suillus plorans]